MKLPDIRYTQNREISWLRFNARVLEEAADEKVKLYERLKFAAIFSSNLAEFFMIRVGSLYELSLLQREKKDNKSLWTSAQQLAEIFPAAAQLYKERDQVVAAIEKQLRPHGVVRLTYNDLTAMEQRSALRYFNDCVQPLLSPQIIDFHHPFPHLVNQMLYIAVLLKGRRKTHLGIIPVPASVPELFFLPGKSLRFIRLAEIILACVGQVFSVYSLIDKAVICLTRDADIDPDAEEAEVDDYPQHMKKILKKRTRLAPVRLEMETQGDSLMTNYLCQRLGISDKQTYITRTPIDLRYVFQLPERFSPRQKEDLLYPPFVPADLYEADGGSLLSRIEKEDLLLFYPYESFAVFLRMMKEAAYDPEVVSIRITIYRMGSHRAKLMNYLALAAELGKEVTVVMELRARFDEANNINWAEHLREAGCNIVYGFKDYKVHAKICLITRRSEAGISYITQIGTGNYNGQTAACYTDFSLLTADPRIGEDASRFFKNMCLGDLQGDYALLLAAPYGLKQQLLEHIRKEQAKAEKGKRGRILMKMNSLTDRELIDALMEASRAGVKIELIIRGICCLLPGIKGLTENIRIVSVVGRFLEHARVFCFGSAASLQVYISSADLMTRNTEKRVEIACPVYAEPLKKRLHGILKYMLQDTVKGRLLQPDGTWKKRGSRLCRKDSQLYFMEQIQKPEEVKEES